MDSKDKSESNIINDFITYILDFKKNIIFTSILCLIIFGFSLSGGGYYYIFKSIKDMISTRLPGNVKPDIVFFILKILIFYSLFKLILSTLFNLIFIDRHNNEKHYCELKDLIDLIVNKLSGLFFGLYMLFLFPIYLFNSLASIYKYIINSLIYILNNIDKEKSIWKPENIRSLERSTNDIKSIKDLLNEEVCNFYTILSPLSKGTISEFFRKIFEKIFIEKKDYDISKSSKNNLYGGIKKDVEYPVEFSSICECLTSKQGKSKKKRKCDINSDDFETKANVTACNYSFSITIYFIILGIFYILLFLLFPESRGIRVVIFIIISLLVIRSMFTKLSFKVATKNIAIFKALMKEISSDTHKKLWTKEQKISQKFVGDFLQGFNPILKYIFGENIYKGPTIKEAFDVEDLLECVNIVCRTHTKEQAATKIQKIFRGSSSRKKNS
tara:strand:+ start:567 stop:1892 length:1326 start_codon:yes stop_codon:yes gene_type:complete